MRTATAVVQRSIERPRGVPPDLDPPRLVASGGRRSWSELGARARTWRVIHAGWSLAQLASLGLIWHRVATRRRDPAMWVCVSFLALEGGALVLGRGDCPMGQLQEGWGDPVPFFELVLPPRAAKAAVPVLGCVSLLAIGGVVCRAPGAVLRSDGP